MVRGDIRTTFSRELTKKELINADKVPLIRVPHSFSGYQFADKINALIDNGYTTVFVFEVRSDSFSREIKEFSEDCLIFLNHIENVISK